MGAVRAGASEWPAIRAPPVTEVLRKEQGYMGSVDLVRRRIAA
jgi:hypothetical protein